jgi:hypothetical protein
MNLYSLLVAVIGSVIFLIVYNAIGRGQQRRRWDDGAGQWSSAQEGLH